MTTIAPLTPYAEARRTLLAAAERRGGRLAAFEHPGAGPDGEVLATDTARFGAPPGEAETVVLVLSGVHGVEGHAGNGLQQELLASGRLEALPEGMAVVLVHAVNPYGMAWTRRVDADNVDVNRSFVDPQRLPANPRYDEVDALLNPTDPDLDPTDVTFLGGLLEFWTRVGEHEAMKTLNGGQYTHPHGVQYGGPGSTWSRTTMEQIWAEHLVGARRAVNLDVHTGLGPLGRLTVFQTADEDEPVAELGRAWYPDHLFRSSRSEAEAVDHGLLGPGFDAWAASQAPGTAPTETATFVLEFGTLDPLKGITAFRADNWLHHHGDLASETGQAIKALVREQFFVDDDGWRRDVGEQGEQAIHAALDGLR